jgi:hypothetical protein
VAAGSLQARNARDQRAWDDPLGTGVLMAEHQAVICGVHFPATNKTKMKKKKQR